MEPDEPGFRIFKMMKRYLLIMLAVVVMAIAGVWVVQTVTPLSYTDKPLREEALAYLQEKQKLSTLTSEQAAQTYLFFQTDYQDASPKSLKLKVAGKRDGSARVMLHQPEVQDDSIHAVVDRIYVRRNSDGGWVPFKHEAAYKGRGRLTWTRETPQ